jgi:hypothetical protein
MPNSMEWTTLGVECLVVLLVTRFVTVPLLVVVHELGHAAAVARAGHRPVVVIGRKAPIFMRDFRRFDLLLHPGIAIDYFRIKRQDDEEEEVADTHIARCAYSSVGMTVRQLRSISKSGPRASILAGLVLAEVAYLIGDPFSMLFWIVTLGSAFAWYEGITTTIAFEPGGFPSDGARLVELRGLDNDEVPNPFPTDHLGRDTPPPVATAAR